MADPGVGDGQRDREARAEHDEGLGEVRGGRRASDHGQHHRGGHRHRAEDARRAEAGKDEHFDRQRQQAHAEQDHFFPAGEAHEEAGAEEQPQRRQAHEAAEAECAGLDLEHQAEDAQREQER